MHAHGANAMLAQSNPIPLWLKLAFSLWLLIWVPSYLSVYGPQNFFWLCNLANFLILIALWTENRLLMSAQLLAVLIVGSVWSLDVGTAALITGTPVLGTDYMFDTEIPLATRMLSIFHTVLPVIAVYAILKLGYDRRGLILQTALTWVVIPLTWLLTDPERNINWTRKPFNQTQDLLPEGLYVIVLMLAWPLLLYVPVHLGILAWRKARA